VTKSKHWIREAAPYLKASLALAKVGLEMTGLPLPTPDLRHVHDIRKHKKFLDCAMEVIQDIVKGNENVMMNQPSSSAPNSPNRSPSHNGHTQQKQQQPFFMLSGGRILETAHYFDPILALTEWQQRTSTVDHRAAQSAIAELLRETDRSLIQTAMKKSISHSGCTQWIYNLDEVEESFHHSPDKPSLAAINAVIEDHAEHYQRVNKNVVDKCYVCCSFWFCCGGK
jgi:hypothetical protein